MNTRTLGSKTDTKYRMRTYYFSKTRQEWTEQFDQKTKIGSWDLHDFGFQELFFRQDKIFQKPQSSLAIQCAGINYFYRTWRLYAFRYL